MAMTQKSFETALKKGEIGERIVRAHLENKGWVVYCPFTKNRAHYFDMLATNGKVEVIAIDVKTKARLNKWNAQGIDLKHYREYLRFVERTNVCFYLVFVDDKTGEVNAADITKLSDPIYPSSHIIAWRLEQCKHLFTIDEANIDELSALDQRQYNFSPKT